MTAVADRPTTAASSSPTPPATRAENLTVVALTIWLMGGLSLDGYAHANIIDTATEDFFTPWHAVFYAAFTSLAAFIGLIAWRRRRPGPLRSWLPAGYDLAVVGLAVFAVGGVGDGIWHTIFGVEVGIDALLSPTHLILLAGGGLIVTAPLRSRLAEGLDGSPSTWRRDGATVGSLTAVVSGMAFFLTFTWGLSFWWATGNRFIKGDGGSEILVALAVAGALITSAALVVPVLWAHRHRLLPTGAVPVIWGVAVFAEAVALSSPNRNVPPVVLGGLVVEVLRRRRSFRLSLIAGVFTIWASWMAMAALDGRAFRWPPEIWAGHVGFTTLVTAWLIVAIDHRQPMVATPGQPSSASS